MLNLDPLEHFPIEISFFRIHLEIIFGSREMKIEKPQTTTKKSIRLIEQILFVGNPISPEQELIRQHDFNSSI